MQQITIKEKENAFDFLRLFAAFSVLIGHAVRDFDTTFLWSSKGHLLFADGVAMFFVLSGMLVYRSCEKSFITGIPIWKYFMNRFLRIAPAIYTYLFITTISFFVLGVLKLSDININFFAWMASTIFLIPVYHPTIFEHFGIGVVNGSLWTIPAEFSFYIVLPIFIVLQRKRNFNSMITVMFLISIISLIFNNFMLHEYLNKEPLWLKFYGISFLPYLLYFSVGIFIGKTWNGIQKKQLLAILSLAMYILIRYEILFSRESVYLIWELIWALPFGYFIVWFGYNAPALLNKITTKIGDISYGIYIWHMVIVNYFIYFGISKINGIISILLLIIITTFLALLSWWRVEKPALKRKPYTTRMEEIKLRK